MTTRKLSYHNSYTNKISKRSKTIKHIKNIKHINDGNDGYNIYNNIPHCNPLIEYKRFELIQQFKKQFTPPIKYNKLDIYNILPRWLMNNVNNTSKDPVLPLNKTKINNKQFIGDILFNYPNISKNEIQNIIDYFNLPSVCKTIFNELKQYEKNNKNVKESVLIINKQNKEHFVILQFDNTIPISVKIPQILYDRIVVKMKKQGLQDIHYIDTFVFCLLVRYNTLDSSNQQLANNPAFYAYLNKHYGIKHELFASGLNSFFPNFCSLYPDLERILGSKGSFNDFSLIDGFYVANPPFDEQIIINMVKRLFTFLRDDNNTLSFFITIPSNWDNFVGLDMIKSSPFLTYYRIIPKHKAKYFNYTTNKYIFPCSVAFIILQNNGGRVKHNIDNFDKTVDKFY